MRFICPTCVEKKWYLTIFFREVGSPQPVRIGTSVLTFGKGREARGQLAYCQIEVTDEAASVEFFPGAKILGVVCSPNPGLDKRYMESLGSIDEVELANPNDIVEISDMSLAREVAGSSSSIQKQLDVLDRKRRKFIGR